MVSAINIDLFGDENNFWYLPKSTFAVPLFNFSAAPYFGIFDLFRLLNGTKNFSHIANTHFTSESDSLSSTAVQLSLFAFSLHKISKFQNHMKPLNVRLEKTQQRNKKHKCGPSTWYVMWWDLIFYKYLQNNSYLFALTIFITPRRLSSLFLRITKITFFCTWML